MTNLQFPSTTLDNLRHLLNGRETKKIAYETHARDVGDVVEIFHHGNAIAVVAENYVKISNAGWESKTTADRLTRILRSNGVPVAVGISNFRMVLRNFEGDHMVETFFPNRKWVTFYL